MDIWPEVKSILICCQVTSYGGNLIYSVSFRLPASGDAYGTVFPDVKIEGANMSIVHQYPEQPVEGRPLTVVLDMVEVSE